MICRACNLLSRSETCLNCGGPTEPYDQTPPRCAPANYRPGMTRKLLPEWLRWQAVKRDLDRVLLGKVP